MIQQRLLDTRESALHRPVSTIMEYRGTIRETDLSDAVRLLSLHHPILRARVVADQGKKLLLVTPDNKLELVIIDGDINTVFKESHAPWDNSKAVARLTLIRGREGGFLVFRAMHGIADGAGRSAWIFALWDLYTKIVTDSTLPADIRVALPLPQSSLKYLKERAGIEYPTRHESSTVYASIERNIRLSERATTEMIAVARAERTSVHALACGVILLAQRSFGALTGPTSMACTSVVSLHNRVSPPVGVGETTHFNVFHNAKVMVQEQDNPIHVGREVKHQLDSAISNGDLTLEEVRFDTTLERRLASFLITNNRSVSRLPQPPGLTHIDMFTQRSSVVPLPVYSIRTYEGHMNIRFDYPSGPFTEDDVDHLVPYVEKQLNNIGSHAIK